MTQLLLTVHTPAGGTSEFRVATRHLRPHSSLLEDHPSLGTNSRYEVRSRVSADSFRQFLGALQGSNPVLTTANVGEISLLSEEFGFTELTEACDRFYSAPGEGHQAYTNQQIATIDESLTDFVRKADFDALKVALRVLSQNFEKSSAEFVRKADLDPVKATVHDLSQNFEKSSAELKAEIAKLRTQIRQEVTPLQGAVDSVRNDLTRSISEFGVRVDQTAANTFRDFNQRLSATEQSVQGLRFRLFWDPPGTPPTEAYSLDGIIRYLAERHGGNVHEKKVVTITSSSVYSDNPNDALRNVADVRSASIFSSKAEARQWVCWDFNRRRVRLTHYTIYTIVFGLKSWILEGSDDGRSWKQLDVRADNQDFRNLTVASFAIAKPTTYRLIRLTQTAQNHFEKLDLRLRGVEFFGALIE